MATADEVTGIAADHVQGAAQLSRSGDIRRDRARQVAMATLVDAESAAGSGTGSWFTPDVDVASLQRRGMRLADELQDASLIPTIVPILGAGDDEAERATQVITGLLPFALPEDLKAAEQALASAPAGERTTVLLSQVRQTMAIRAQGVAAQAPTRSGAAIHWREVVHGLGDVAYDMTVGTLKQAWADPLKFPVRLAAGMATSFHHAIRDSGNVAVGLFTSGAHGSFGAGATQSLVNSATWASGFSGGRRTGLHPQFAGVQALTKEGLARTLAGHAGHRRPVLTNRLARAVPLPGVVTRTVGSLESGVRHQVNRLRFGMDLIYEGTPAHHRKGAVWKALGDEPVTVAEGHVLGTGDTRLMADLSHKYTEYQVVTRAKPGSMPETHLGSNLLQELGLERPKPGQEAQFLKQVQARLDEKFPQGYFVKGVNDFSTGGNIPSNRTAFAEMYQGYVQEFLPFKEKLLASKKGVVQVQLREHPFHAGRALDKLLHQPEKVVIQAKVDAKLYTTRKLPKTVQPTQEIRVHVVDGKVVPGASAHRWQYLRTFTDRTSIRQAETFVQGIVDDLPESLTKTMSLAPDVIQLKDGSFQLIELNAGGNSGFLRTSPVTAHRLIEAVTGKETRALYTLRSLRRSAVASILVATHQHQTPEAPPAGRRHLRITGPGGDR